MARTDVPVVSVSPNGNILLSFTTGDATNDHEMSNDGVTVLMMVVGAASTPTLTVISTPDNLGRTGDITQLYAATTTRVFGPFAPTSAWNQTNGKVNLDLDTDTLVTLVAFRLP